MNPEPGLYGYCEYCDHRVPFHFMRSAIAEGILGLELADAGIFEQQGSIFRVGVGEQGERPAEQLVVRACAACMYGDPYPEGFGPADEFAAALLNCFR